MRWFQLWKRRRETVTDTEDEALLMRAEERTEANERRLSELIIRLEIANLARDAGAQR